jgi:hypothetical protein
MGGLAGQIWPSTGYTIVYSDSLGDSTSVNPPYRTGILWSGALAMKIACGTQRG